MNTNNSPSTSNIEGLSSLVETSNTKDINTDTGRATYSGLVGALIRVAVVINNTPIQRDVPDHSIVTDNIIRI